MFTEQFANGETPPSLDGFIKFLETKPADGRYEWVSSCKCACAQYLESIGQYKEHWLSSGETMANLNRIAGGMWDPNKWAGAGGYHSDDWTFGKCLDRAKKVKELA